MTDNRRPTSMERRMRMRKKKSNRIMRKDEETTKSMLLFNYNRIKIPLQSIRKQSPWVSRKRKGR
jgi:hypothetical protein